MSWPSVGSSAAQRPDRVSKKYGGPRRAPFFALPPSSGFGAAKPAHPGNKRQPVPSVASALPRLFPGNRHRDNAVVAGLTCQPSLSRPQNPLTKIQFLEVFALFSMSFGRSALRTVLHGREQVFRAGRDLVILGGAPKTVPAEGTFFS